MSIELTEELRREVERAGEDPVRLIDPETREEFIVLRASVFDHLCRTVEIEAIDLSFYEFIEKRSPR